MGKMGRKKRGRNRGYFYRNGRGWYANDGKAMVPLVFPDGSRVKELRPDGTAVFEHQVDSVDMSQKLTGSQEVRYNSKTDKSPPHGFEHLPSPIVHSP